MERLIAREACKEFLESSTSLILSTSERDPAELIEIFDFLAFACLDVGINSRNTPWMSLNTNITDDNISSVKDVLEGFFPEFDWSSCVVAPRQFVQSLIQAVANAILKTRAEGTTTGKYQNSYN
jgi:hypothetical protein